MAKGEKRVQQNTSQPGVVKKAKALPANTGTGGKRIMSSPGKSKSTNLKAAHPNPNVKGSTFPKRGKGK